MKIIYSVLVVGSFYSAFSQQQLGSTSLGNTNAPFQGIQTNILVNTGNLNAENNNNNSDNNILQQQYANYNDNIGNQMQQSINNEKQSNEVVSNGRGFDLSFDFSSRSFSSSGTSSKKTNRRIFQKKLKKFNRNFYGKLVSHKKSKHLVDVCFNWSK